MSALEWVPTEKIVYTTKITVATIVYEIFTSLNDILFTLSSTEYNRLPQGYTVQALDTNSDGTAVATLPILQSDGEKIYSILTYPTPYVDYSTEYHWLGTLPTHDKSYDLVCATAHPSPSNIPLYQHPEYNQPKLAPHPDEEDPSGTSHTLVWLPIAQEPDASFFQAAFPSESAFFACTSLPPSLVPVTGITTAKFITESRTVYSVPVTQPAPHTENSVTGFEPPSTRPTVSIGVIRIQSSAPGLETTVLGGGGKSVTVGLHLESSVSGFKPGPQAQQTGRPEQPTGNRELSLPEILIGIIAGNPAIFSSGIAAQQATHTPNPGNPGNQANPTPAAAVGVPTPAFTLVSTVVNGQSTTIPAYILPGSSETATIGQTITLNGTPTILSLPSTFFTMIPTTINGIATSVPAYIINATSTATIGQTVTINGIPTVLIAPSQSVLSEGGLTGTSVGGGGPQATGAGGGGNGEGVAAGIGVSWWGIIAAFIMGIVGWL
ncbi:hypothetical protein K469DRAFT_688198 [Zopfia rhizophila CBS 207.26]|uniref:Uncharacterized protein n=1 Tax=Zopfia rhizophila CBS 207.26 TaxID=1314779 RepID=A0A6A6E393_9PEZI|nr:hypothetical protein K469DRAFT_688198 [Zopfia rhizophila CBS 207.26]